MRWEICLFFGLISFGFMGCGAVLTPPPQSPTPTAVALTTIKGRATPTLAPDVFLTPIPPTPTFTPSPMPTPVMHIIAQGDTLFGIALEYGVSLDALVQANGIEADQILSIGKALIIPLDEEDAAMEYGMTAPMGNVILPTPTPLPLSTAGAALYKTPVGGIWCMGEVINTTAGPVTNLQVQATLLATGDTPLVSQVTMAAADYLLPGSRAPFAMLFQAPPAGVSDVRVVLLRAESIGAITSGFVPLSVVDTEGATSGPQYRVTGRVVNDSDGPVRRISVVVTLYDEDQQVLGYRHAVLREESPVLAGQDHAFTLLLTPQGLNEPAAFQILAWASTAE